MAAIRARVSVQWTCTLLVISLIVESHHTQQVKLNPHHWGPQSMMYLKGKYGRRYLPDAQGTVKLGLNGWFTAIKGFQRLRSVEFRNPRIFLTGPETAPLG
ncbi:spexin prohormone 2-like [Osmerus eperlanus]|uniref:spexin prohormone 2-like n=1 Tax=Osmerus eperlanus TaxID=29151 RepID=UPI002E10D58D